MEKKKFDEEKFWEKSLKKKYLKKNEKSSTQGMLLFERSQEKNIFIFFCFGYATQNKALNMIKLVSKNFVSSKNLWCKFQKNR